MMGGFGNNLFQLNYAYYLRSNGCSVIINNSLLKDNNFASKCLGWTNHNSEKDLCKLGLLENFIVNKRINFVVLLFGLISKYIKRYFINVKYCGLLTPKLKELESHGIKNLHLFGYFHEDNATQDNFRLKINHEINNFINHNLKLHSFIEIINTINTVVIHVRGGDFLNLHNCSLNSTYYARALSEVSDLRDVSFCVITNDNDFAKEILNVDNLTFVEFCSALDDFVILVKSKFKILSNSTFAWWSGELSDESSIIIEPCSYYGQRLWNPISLATRIKVKN